MSDVDTAKRVEMAALLCLAAVFASVVLWHALTSDQVAMKASKLKAAASSGRVFFFQAYWFKLIKPEQPGKPFRLSYYDSDRVGEPAVGCARDTPLKSPFSSAPPQPLSPSLFLCLFQHHVFAHEQRE